MREFLQFAILGIGPGAVYCLLGQGILLVYRGAGVVNFAQGAMAMLGAFMFFTWGVQSNIPLVFAALGAIAVTAAAGGFVFVAVMRPLRNASTIVRQVATLAVLTTVQGFGLVLWGGNELRQPASILPRGRLEVGNVGIGVDRMFLLAIALLSTYGLWMLFRKSTIGLTISAGSEHPLNVSLLGWSPDMLALFTWGIGAALGGLAGILIAPISGLNVFNLSFLIIPALAATLLASFRSFPILLSAAMAIGIVEALAAFYANSFVGRSVSFLAIVAVLIVRGRGLPIRGESAERLPAVGSGEIRWTQLGIALAAVIALIATVASGELIDSITYTAAMGVIVLSVVVVTGYAGQISLAQFMLAGVGALISARLVADQDFPFLLAALVAVVGTTLIGVAFAIPALRTRGINLAVVTLGLGTVIQTAVFNNRFFVGSGGFSGVSVGPQKIFGVSIDPIFDPENYAIFTVLVLAATGLMVANVRRSGIGRRLLAVRGNERAAASLGISLMGAKIFAFAFGAGVAAIGGILLGFRNHSVLINEFDALGSILVLSYALIGGVGFVLSPIFGAGLADGAIFPELAGSVGIESYVVLLSGIGMVLILKFRPDGLASLFDRRRRQMVAGAHSIEPGEIRRVKPAVLEASGMSVTFGVTKALDEVELRVEPGEVVGLMGANGAGKTTFLDAVTGVVPAAGTVTLAGERIDNMSVHKRARAGLGRSFQMLELFDDLTIRENLQVASDDLPFSAYLTAPFRPRKAELSPAAAAAARDFNLEPYLDMLPSQVSNGMRHQVAIARAVAQEPSILLLDEPAAGIDEGESTKLAQLVRRLADEWGIAIVVIEHDVPFLMRVCDRITVLDFGRVIAEGPPDEVRTNPAVVAAYLGEEEDDVRRQEAYQITDDAEVPLAGVES